MEASDKRVELLKPLLVQTLRLDEEKWRELVSVKKHLVYLNSFFNTRDMINLYMWLNADGGACMSLDFPVAGHKVICLGKTQKETVTTDNMASTMLIEEIHADDVLTFISTLTQEVSKPPLMLVPSP